MIFLSFLGYFPNSLRPNEIFQHFRNVMRWALCNILVDVIANKNNKTFYFQVKHKDLSNSYPVEITKSTYQIKSGNDYYLVVVMLSEPEDARKFLIIPWAMIDNWIDKEIIRDNGTKYLLHIEKVDNNFKIKDEAINIQRRF